ncbi:MAG TPA: hypothetical protein VKX45_01145 [Bryobacteraceae bacterium]|nr:hypothetical protein [Bryobacteraceae bacterium]
MPANPSAAGMAQALPLGPRPPAGGGCGSVDPRRHLCAAQDNTAKNTAIEASAAAPAL